MKKAYVDEINREGVLGTLKKLPTRCYVGPTEAKKLGIEHGYAIWRGVMGYEPRLDLTDEKATHLNAYFGVEHKHITAMQAGSMFGWEVPGADPDTYTEE